MKKSSLIIFFLSVFFIHPFDKAAAKHKPKLQDSTISRHTETEGKAYKVRATVKKIYLEERKITLKHERIKGYMPAMTMTFSVSKQSLLNNIAEGDRGLFTIFVYKGLPKITGMKLSTPRKRILHDKKELTPKH